MGEQALIPNQKLNIFDGPGGERFALVVSHTGRSIAVQTVDGSATAGRIWHPLEDRRRVEVEDRWRARGANWIKDFRVMTLAAWSPLLARFVSDADLAKEGLFTPSSSLGSFTGPQAKNCFALVVSRTGRTVVARLGSERGLIVARAISPLTAKPKVVYQGMYRYNSSDWKREFRDLFTAALRTTTEAAQASTAAAGGAAT